MPHIWRKCFWLEVARYIVFNTVKTHTVKYFKCQSDKLLIWNLLCWSIAFWAYENIKCAYHCYRPKFGYHTFVCFGITVCLDWSEQNTCYKHGQDPGTGCNRKFLSFLQHTCHSPAPTSKENFVKKYLFHLYISGRPQFLFKNRSTFLLGIPASFPVTPWFQLLWNTGFFVTTNCYTTDIQ